MTAVARLAAMEVKLFFREKMQVFWTFLFPIFFIWIFGMMFGDQQVGGLSFSQSYVPAWIGVNLVTTSFFTLGTVMAGYRESGVLRRFSVTPIRPWAVMTAQIAQGLVIFLISALVLFTFGFFAFDLHLPKYVGSTILAVLLAVLAMFPFALFITSFAKNTRTAAAISSFFLNIMMFLSGATFPFEMMPISLQYVGKGMPLYYVIELLRQTWNFTPIWENGLHVGVLLGMATVSILLASKYFKWGAE